jgi:hypothetical protein
MNDWPPHHKTNFMFVFLGMLFCLYLIWPAFSAVHLEGFTAQTQSIALLKSQKPFLEHDPYLPLVSQFIYQTRSAAVDALSLIYCVAPNATDSAFQILVLLSFILLVGSSIAFARRYGNVSTTFGFFALILTPGIPETAFFFNDNIISAGLAVAALAVVSKTPRIVESLISGILLSLAILSRVDAIFMLPVIAGTTFYNVSHTSRRLLACSVFSGSILAVLGISSIYHGFSPVDAFATAHKFILDTGNWKGYVFVRIYFFGLIIVPFLAIGLRINYRNLATQKSYIGILTFVVYPIALIVLAPKATEVRYIFPLMAPLVALHGGRGIHWVYERFTSTKEKPAFLAIFLAAGIVLVMFFPTTLVQMRDGPRSVLGRIWSPLLWITWQESVTSGTVRFRKLVSLLDSGKLTVLVTTHYNDEFFVRLRLIEAGFLPSTTSNEYPGCNGFSLFKKGSSEVAHIRTAPQYRIAPITIIQNAALQISSAFECPAVQRAGDVYITTFGINDYGFQPAIYNAPPTSFDEPLVVRFHDSLEKLLPRTDRSFGILNYRKLGSQDISHIRSNASTYVRESAEKDPLTGKGMTIQNYMAYYKPMAGPTSERFMAIHSVLAGN